MLFRLLFVEYFQEREARKKIEEEKRREEEAKKQAAAEKRKAAYAERKRAEEERKRIQQEKRKIAYEKRKAKEAEMRAQGIPFGRAKKPDPVTIVTRKRGPGRPPKAETLARLQAQLLLLQQQEDAAAAAGRRGRGRPRKDGSAPVPRKKGQGEISAANLYMDTTDLDVERSRSGRKIQRTIFHDEVELPSGGGLMKRPRTDEHGGIGAGTTYVAERSAAAAAKSALRRTPGMKKEQRRKPGARDCMQMTRKFDAGVIPEATFDVLLDYAKRGKVDHLIRMRERLDEHSRMLESELAGLEALVKENEEKGEGKAPEVDTKAE